MWWWCEVIRWKIFIWLNSHAISYFFLVLEINVSLARPCNVFSPVDLIRISAKKETSNKLGVKMLVRSLQIFWHQIVQIYGAEVQVGIWSTSPANFFLREIPCHFPSTQININQLYLSIKCLFRATVCQSTPLQSSYA